MATITQTVSELSREQSGKMVVPEKLKRDFDWFKVIIFLHLNVLSVLSIYLCGQAMIRTVLFLIFVSLLGLLGITAGAHRLWAHKSYKATKGLRIFLMICQTLAGQGSIYNWVLQHRIHHRYYGTNFDPYNHKRGFLYSHFIQFLEKPHEFQDDLEAEIDMSDVKEDGVVMFQHKYFYFFYAIVFVLLPMNAPAEYWGEDIVLSIMILGWLRQYIVLNLAWLVHSAVLIWGLQPNERYPCDTNMVFFVNKTFWIPYHYMAPWDYLTGEFGKYATDCTSKFIRACAAVGYASELKTVDSEHIKDAIYKAAVGEKPLADCLNELENLSIEKELYLKPVNVMM